MTIAIIIIAVAIIAAALKLAIGFPVLGGTIPVIVRRKLPLNRDGSFVDTGAAMIEDEVGYYFIRIWAFEWLGVGLPLTKGYVRLTSNGEIVSPDFDVAGG